MKYYIILNQILSESVKDEISQYKSVPTTDLTLLSHELNASFLRYKQCPIKPEDIALSKIWGDPENWAFARYLATKLKPDDVVFCPGEEIGIPLANIFSNYIDRPKIVIWFHRITGLRTRLALKLLKVTQSLNLAVVNTLPNQAFLHNHLNLSKKHILHLKHTIDCNFFVPGVASPGKSRPMIASVGLEQRDYILLAKATEKLNVDVKVAGFSQFQSRIAKSFPKVLPANMTNKRYQLQELIELYHNADLVVVPLKENNGAAGVTALLEAMACNKPTICVRTKGLAEYINETAVITIKPGDLASLHQAILYLLNNPEESQRRAEKAHGLACAKHNLDSSVKVLAEFIQTAKLLQEKTLASN